MKRHLFIFKFSVFAFLPAGLLLGQSPGVSLPRNRELVVAAALSLENARTGPIVVAEDVGNPFNWPEDLVPEAIAVGESTAPAPVVLDTALLARLAAQIPATGTIIVGSEYILLLGQKRIRVGELVTTIFEGKNYELTIVNIARTSFTVGRGTITHTRATYLMGSSPNNFRP